MKFHVYETHVREVEIDTTDAAEAIEYLKLRAERGANWFHKSGWLKNDPVIGPPKLVRRTVDRVHPLPEVPERFRGGCGWKLRYELVSDCRVCANPSSVELSADEIIFHNGGHRRSLKVE